MRLRSIWLLIGALVTAASVASAQESYPIAGTAPDRRPDGAPVIRELTKDDAWYSRALTGLEPPYPASFRFLEDQGNWYTPFNHPGGTGRYDIRGWYRGVSK